MATILPQEGSFASNFGAGLGSGLAQQIPEEIKRYRLTRGLQELAQNTSQQTPYQILSSLASIPGLDPGLLNALAPALQQQIARNEALQGSPSAPQSQAAQTQQPSFQGAREDRPGYLQEPSGQQVETLANRLFQVQPNLYPTLEAARNQARSFLGQEVAADRSYQQRLDLFENEFDKSINSYLQKDKSLQEGELSGQVREMLRQRALDEVRGSNVAPRSIADKYARQALEIAKEKQSMRKIYEGWNKINPPSDKEIDSLRKLKGKYDQYHIPQDIFIDDLAASQNISRGAASYIADPLYETKAGKALHSTPQNRGIEAVKGVFTNQEAKLAEKVAPLITSKDLVGSLAYIAQAKGYNGERFLAELQKRLNPDQITEMQGRDLRERQIPNFRSLDEIWLLGFSGERKKARK